MATNTTARRSAEHTRTLILAALAEATAPVTVADLADQAGVAKSTLGKYLPALEKEGRAVRTPGGRDGRRRLPDQWALAATASHDTDTEPETEAGAGAGGEDTATEVTDDAVNIPGLGSVSAAALDAVSAGRTSSSGDTSDEGRSAPAAPVSEVPTAPAPPNTGTDRIGARAEAEANPVSGSMRLAPGELKLMVRAILDADPDEEFAATAISHILQGRSIGAIQNNLARLAKEGHAVQTCAKPRRYRSARHAG